MALAGPLLALPTNDEENVDFFDRLAHDLGQGEGLHQNCDKGEGVSGEALSELSMSDGDAAVAYRQDTSGILANEICMLEAGSIAHLNTAASTMLEASEVDTSLLDASIADGNASEADALTPIKVDDLQQHASNQDFNSRLTLCEGSAPIGLDPSHCAVQNGGAEPTTVSPANSLTSQSDLVPSDDDPQVKKPLPPQSTVKELQWSCFSEIYTLGEGPNALNDFLSELDAGTGALVDQSLGYQPAIQADSPIAAPPANSNSPFNWKTENGNVPEHNAFAASVRLGDDIVGMQLHSYGIYGIPNQLETHQSQALSNNSASFSYYGASNQPLGEPGIDQGGERMAFAEGATFGNHNTEGASFSQQYGVLSTEAGIHHSSLGNGQLHGGSYTINSSLEIQQQASAPESWESMYPGWYFDYTSNQWKQIEGWDFNTGSMAVENRVLGSTVRIDSYSTSSTTNAISSHSDLNQAAGLQTGGQKSTSTSGFIKAIDDFGSVVHEHANYTGSTGQEETVLSSLGSVWEGQSLGSEQATLDGGYEQRTFNGDSQSQVQVPWEEQYPGWYFDYQAQQWRQIAVDSNQSLLHGHSSSIDTSQVAGGLVVQPALQHETDKNVDWREEGGVAYDHGGDKVTITQDLSFHGWELSAVAATPSDSAGVSTENVKEAFQFENNGSAYGLQSYSNSVSQLYNQPETQGTLGNKLSLNSYSSHQLNQPHNIYRPAAETKQFTIERPSHPLVAFGFGGKLVTMKASSSKIPETVVLHDLNQLVLAEETSGRNDGVSYFFSLNRGGLAGPLVGGGITTKDLLKWVDDRIAICDSDDLHCTSAEALRVLWGVLRIACLHYGKLRSVNGSTSLKSQSEEGPELDLGKLLSTTSSQSDHNQSIASQAGLQSVSSEHQLQAIAVEMKRQLVGGKKKEALQLAQQGHLWGPALVLAWHLGEKAYAETVLQMVQHQFVLGSPLRTLFLLFGGQTAELFTTKGLPSPVVAAGPDSLGLYTNMKDSAGGMLGDWMGNLSIIAANPTNGDEQVITHLGDCLWKDHGEVAGAHACYLVADASFEPFSENARLCLVGADHFKWQRTFATPSSIQRTELYEYAKALGNPQFTLLPFQPYKLLYAYMLAEAGKVSEARRYCQAVTKTLKNAGRVPEIDFCRQSATSLEERLRLHSQGGYNLNSATGKLVGKLRGTLDSTLHRIIGGPPPRQASEPSLNKNPRDWYSSDQRMDNSAKLAEASMLDPTVPTEKLSRFNHRQVEAPPRSVSEPNLSWSPVKKENNTATNSEVDGDSSKQTKFEPGGAGYLGRFGSQLFSKAISFIKSNKTKANLGDENKFYYNKDLKKWVEEGAEQTLEDVALPPPPITAGFKSNGGSVLHDAQGGAKVEGPDGSRLSSLTEIPPLPPSGNQFSARGRLHGVRSRYVDTFNKGGALPAKSTDLPLVPSAGWGLNPPPTQFFIPAHTATPDFVTEASEEHLSDNSNSMSASSTTENSQIQYEKGALLPKDLPSSFTAVPSMQSHSSSGLPNGNKALLDKNHSGMKLDGFMYAAAQDFNPLPVPPIIEPPVSSLAVENGIYGKSDEPWQSRLPGSVQGGILTDMQEVEL